MALEIFQSAVPEAQRAGIDIAWNEWLVQHPEEGA
jgi:hypothetical protein